MLATLFSAALAGLDGRLIRVEVDVANGLPGLTIVGLPDAALSEARERVRSAIRNSGFEYPARRITVNLAPAEVRKAGASFDLAIALGVLIGDGEVRPGTLDWALLGELSLGGELQPVPGVLPMVAVLVAAGHPRVVVPVPNVAEARLVPGAEPIPAATLAEAVLTVAPRSRKARAGVPPRVVATTRTAADDRAAPPPGDASIDEVAGPNASVVAVAETFVEPADLAEVRGQAFARWALEVALAGGHNLLVIGPPGAGKTLLARTVPGLLPPLDDAEALEVTIVASVAGLLLCGDSLRRARPFRAPHHTASYAAMVGGGPGVAPGEVTLAHRGVLFLDELAEFDRDVLEALRQPLEDGSVAVARAGRTIRFPARFQLLAATNPCRCGYLDDPVIRCTCRAGEAERYLRRVSGPLLDRIDCFVAMPRVPPRELLRAPEPEASAPVAARIAVARALALARNGGRPNAALAGRRLRATAMLDPTASRLLERMAEQGAYSARSVHRALRVARTVADLHGNERIGAAEIAAAISLREPGTELGSRAP